MSPIAKRLREWHLKQADLHEQVAIEYEVIAEARCRALKLDVRLQGELARSLAKQSREKCRRHIAAATDLTDYREPEIIWRSPIPRDDLLADLSQTEAQYCILLGRQGQRHTHYQAA